MASKYKNKKLEFFSIHARTKFGPIKSYEEFFQAIAHTDTELRNDEQSNKIIALPVIEIKDGLCKLIAVEGPKGESPLIYDSADSTMHIEKLTPKQIVGTKTHVVINIKAREAAVEFNYRGAKAADVEYLLGKIGRRLPEFDSLEFNLNVKVSESLIAEIDRFERIRVAKIKVARPNIDWTDSHNTVVEIAKDSNAHNLSLEATAGRKQSLKKNSGLVGFLKGLTRGTLSSIKSGSIIGTREGEKSETTVSTLNHVDHVKTPIAVDVDGNINSKDANERIIAVLAARNRQNKPK